MAEVLPEFKTQGVYELRGGIERYMRTFPQGGYWKGKNYVFDKRRLQVPEAKDAALLHSDLEELARKEQRAVCVVCGVPCDEYRGKNSCGGADCGVPVIVCQPCLKDVGIVGAAAAQTKSKSLLRCPLCKEGYVAPTQKPDLLGQKLLLEEGHRRKKRKRDVVGGSVVEGATRLFVGKIPLVVTAAELEAALCLMPPAASSSSQTSLRGNVTCVQWIRDQSTGLFYGSSFVEMKNHDLAVAAVDGAEKKKVALKGRNLKVSFAPPKEGDVWPPANHVALDRPKVF
jgi:hypothetical protein